MKQFDSQLLTSKMNWIWESEIYSSSILSTHTIVYDTHFTPILLRSQTSFIGIPKSKKKKTKAQENNITNKNWGSYWLYILTFGLSWRRKFCSSTYPLFTKLLSREEIHRLATPSTRSPTAQPTQRLLFSMQSPWFTPNSHLIRVCELSSKLISRH